MIDKQELSKWFETKGLSNRSIENYMFYFDRFKFETLNQKYLIWFLQRNNNNVARAFIRNVILYIKTNDFPPEYQTLINELNVPKRTGRPKTKLPNIITREQVHQIASQMNGIRDRVMVLLSFYCGLRLGELLSITPDSFKWDVWLLNKNNFGEVKVIGKGNKERTIIVLPELMDSIYNWIINDVSKKQARAKPLFNIKDRRWQSILERASKKALGRRVNPHLLRHSYITYLLDQGMDITEVKEIAGHESITSTMIYVHLSKKKINKKLERVFR